MSKGTLAISWGNSGGFYFLSNSVCKRLCLGKVAFTWTAFEIDDLMRAFVNN